MTSNTVSSTPMLSLSTGNKSAYNKTAYTPPVRNKAQNNNEPRMNPFLRNNMKMMNNEQMKKQPAPAPEENAVNFPVLSNGNTTTTQPTVSQPQPQPHSHSHHQITKCGYNKAVRIVPEEKPQVVKGHNPNHIVLSKKNLKANEPIIQAVVNEIASSRNQILNQRLEKEYYEEHDVNLIEEMRFKLSEKKFIKWCNKNIDENGKYKYTKSYYGYSSSDEEDN